MKNLKYTLLLLAVLVMGLAGCADNSDFRDIRNEALTSLTRGGFIQFEDVNQRLLLGGADPNTAVFRANIEDPNNNATSFVVNIATSTDTIQYTEITSFPSELVIEGAQIRTLLGRDLRLGESIQFFNTVTIESGETFTPEPLDISTDANGVTTVNGGNSRFELFQAGNTGLRQAMSFSLLVYCPELIAEQYAGTYVVTGIRSRAHFDTDQIITAVAGPGEDQVTLQGLLPARAGWTGTMDLILTFEDDGRVRFDQTGGFVAGSFGDVTFTQSSLRQLTFQCLNFRTEFRGVMRVSAGSFGFGSTFIEKQ